MKRDMDLVRKILLAIEASPTGWAPRNPSIEGYNEWQIGYHTVLLVESGLVEGENVTGAGDQSPVAIATRLTWAGHDFLDAAREPNRWEQARQAIAKIGGASIQVWIGVLTKIMTNNLGLD